MDTGHQATGSGILFEFGRIDIHQVDHQPPLPVARDVLPHLPGEYVDRADRPLAQGSGHVSGYVGVVERRQQDRETARHRLDTGKCHRLAACGHAIACGAFRQQVLAGAVGGRFGKAGDVHRRQTSQLAEQMMRPDLVTAIGGKRQAVSQEQNFALHPRPRETCGPIRLASARGRRFHAATSAACLPLAGLMSRAWAPCAVQLA